MKLDDIPKFNHIGQALAFHNTHSPSKIAYRYLKDGEEETGTITYSQLHDSATNLAYELLRVAQPGDRALLLYPQGLEFVTALYGCFLAGIIAVPIYPPSGKKRTERLENVAKDCEPSLALTSHHLGLQMEQWFQNNVKINKLNWIYTDKIEAKTSIELKEIRPQDVALLQYTSGSTGDPKGVEITHANLVHNNHELLRAVDGCTEVVCWLPVYHDMGLIGNLIYVVYCGGTLTLMSPIDFVRKPLRWLKALSDFRATGTGAPNFAYDLCTRHISDSDLENIDLSHWHATCNGAEPIRPDTLRRFTARFSKVGFREEAFVPCYGLAEATALVAGGRKAIHYLKLKNEALLNSKIEIADGQAAPNTYRELASSGPPAVGMKVEIIDPDSHQRSNANEIGEVWIQGMSVAKGYWNKPTLNKELFQAEIRDANNNPISDEGKWLRSGDMGFMHGGMLYISGRLKEMLVINGANIFPQDIERTIQDVSPIFEENTGAVFGVEGENGTERIIAFQEVTRSAVNELDPEAIFKEVNERVLSINELGLSGIYIISPGRLPKTTSGKIRRLECAKTYKNKKIPGLLHYWDIMDTEQKQNDNNHEFSQNSKTPMEVKHFSTLVDAIAHHNEYNPEQIAFRYLIDGETEGAMLTRKEVHDQSRAIAARLLELANPGDRVILLYPSGLDFITAFFGCLMAGIIAVPMYPPSGRRRLERLESVAKDCAPVLALSLSEITDQAKAWFSERDALKDIVWLNSDEIQDTKVDIAMSSIDPEAVAFLQYTSGSTGDPKGVEVTHTNIVHNNHMITYALTPLTNIVSWLPIYHDMGLIGNILLSTYVGVPLTLMSPVDFIRKPIRWLRAITKYKPEAGGAPNFAFDLCTQQITDEEMQGLDLSSFTSACNGAEPIKPSTLKKFQERFAKVGFSKDAFLPCYGMAEATLIVTGKYGCNTPIEVDSDAMLAGKVILAQDDPNVAKKREVVSSGPLLPEMRVEIVNPDTRQRAAQGSIGEIWIQGKSVAKGYWNRPDLNKEIFQAQILDEQNQVLKDEGYFLRSGDMGFMDQDLLYITGRLKEMLIIGGANIYPQDIERTVQEAHSDLQENAGAVFSVEVEGSTEKVLIFQEIARASIRDYNADEIFKAVSKEVMFHHELAVGGIYLISPGGIPKTTSGKIQRTRCRQAYLEGDIPKVLAHWDIADMKRTAPEFKPSGVQTEKRASDQAVRQNIQSFLLKEITEMTGISESKLDFDTSFANLGISSIQGIQLAEKLSKMLGREIPPTDLYNYSSINQLTQHVLDGQSSGQYKGISTEPLSARKQTYGAGQNEPIAIIGMSCRMPGADNIDSYWSMLENGRDAIKEIPLDRWNSNEFFAEKQAPGKMVTKWGGLVNDVDLFDAAFFEISPREAALMDPQQRLLLQETYRLLESAGYPSEALRGSNVGVYIGIAGSDYAGMMLREVDDRNIYVATGSSYSIAANRISYYFNFSGPSVALDTACSSSLVSVHLAVQALRNGECPMAVAGGVNLILAPDGTLSFSESGLMAKDGYCKTFDANANGIVRSDGCGVILLKPLSQALADGDQIHALIRGAAINQDGRSNGLTAPNGLAQEECLRKALENAGVAANEVAFVETHGTGTILGDPIEVNALNAVYGSSRNAPLVLGSVKANIGHTEGAAGIAGLIKAVLALKHRHVPKQIHFADPNPQIKWTSLNVAVAKDGHSFNHSSIPLRAGVSSFGFGGTNAHIVLEEAPVIAKAAPPELPARAIQILPLSAKDAVALHSKVDVLDQQLASDPGMAVDALAYTLSAARDHFRHRAVVFGSDHANLRKGLADLKAGEESLFGFAQIERNGPMKVAYLFTGAGPQYPGMGTNLYANEPVFKKALDACVAYAKPFLEKDLKSVIFCSPDSEEHKLLNRIDYMQPAVFAYEYSMYKLWESIGVKPDVVIGHSLGELVAACVAGVMDLESAVKLTARRGELIYKMPVPGTMASVQANEAEVLEAIGSRSKVSVAVLNGPNQTTVSGEVEEVEAIVDHFDKMGRKTKVLNISRAGHSPLMDAISDAFREVAGSFKMHAAHIPVISNVSGKVAGDEIASAQYWVDHLRQPVRFYDGLVSLKEMGVNAMIELGPNPVLLGIAGQSAMPANAVAIASANEEDARHEQFYLAVAKYYSAGGNIDWSSYFAERPKNLTHTAPYPFNKTRHWIAPASKKRSGGKSTGQALLQNSLTVAGVEGVYELGVSWQLIPYLRHHQIIDALIAPGSFHVELILEYIAHSKKDLIIRELSIQRPLFIEEETVRNVQLVVEKQELSDVLSVKIYSSDSSGSDWTLHVAGSLQKPKEAAAIDRIDPQSYKQTFDHTLDPKKFYKDLADIGFHYGESFQGVQELYAGPSMAFAKLALQLHGDEAAKAVENQLHPTLLDAAFQLLMAADGQGGQKETYLPFAIEHMQLAVPNLSTCWAELKTKTSEPGADILACTIKLYTESGDLAASFDFSCKKASPDQIVGGAKRLRTDWLYDVQWKDFKPAAETESRPDNLLILCKDEISERFDGFLLEVKSRGIPHTVVSDWMQCKIMLYNARYDALAVVWDTEPTDSTIPDKTRETAITALELLQEVISGNEARGGDFIKQVYWITEGFASGKVNVVTAPVWGIGRTFGRESNIPLTLVDIDLNSYESEGLAAVLFSSGSENQIRLAENKVQAMRLVKHRQPNAEQHTPTAKSTYLITGGLGDLGLQAATWIASNTDVAHLLLWARRAPSKEAMACIAEIEEGGTKVTVASVDVKDAAAVNEAIAAIPNEYPLKGVLHIAGVAEDALIPDQNEEKFDKVLNPKVYGAWNLHEATKEMELEVFCMYSSLSAIAGVPGVSNYAAGNTFLDTLAQYRRQIGLKAHSLNWGAWATSTGLLDAARVDDFRKYMRARGVDLIEGEAGLDILGYSLRTPALLSQTLVAPLILGSQGPFQLASGELQPLYLELFNASTDEAGPAKSDLRKTLYKADPEDRHEILAAAIKKQVGLVIRHENPDAIDAGADLFSLGVDSLMAAEMVSRLSKMIKEPLAPTIIFDQRTVNELTEFLLEVTIDFSADDYSDDANGQDEGYESASESAMAPAAPAPVMNNPAATQALKDGIASHANGDWESALKQILSEELKRRGKDSNALEDSRSLRRQIARLASVLNKRT